MKAAAVAPSEVTGGRGERRRRTRLSGRRRPAREFELVVAWLERLLDGVGSTIKSPERVEGQSRALREIDVTKRYRDDHGDEKLVMIECRRHAKPQDIKWLDELSGKRVDVQANAVVAVSASGFSQGARGRAAMDSIDLRTVAPVAADDLRWFERAPSSLNACKARIQSITVVLAETGGPPSFPSETPLLRWHESGVLQSVVEAAQVLWRSPNVQAQVMPALSSGSTREGDRMRRLFRMGFAQAARLDVQLDDGWREVVRLDLEVELWVEPIATTVSAHRYLADETSLAEFVTFDVDMVGPPLVLSIGRTVQADDDGNVTLSLRAHKNRVA